MKILVVYYSRTNVTRMAAQAVSRTIGADLEEIRDFEKRNGISGFFRCEYEAAFGKLTKIGEVKSDIAGYDLVLVGTPVWAGKPATPVTSFIKKYANKINNLAVLAVHGDTRTSCSRAIRFLENAAGKKAVKALSVPNGRIRKTNYCNVVHFANELNQMEL